MKRKSYNEDILMIGFLFQDCVVASVMLTIRGKFFNRQDYQQLVYTGLSDHIAKIRVLPPAILKPQQLWSGKQVISTLLLNIIPQHKARPSFSFKTSVKVDVSVLASLHFIFQRNSILFCLY